MTTARKAANSSIASVSSSRFQVREVLRNEAQIPSLLDHRRVVLVLQIQPGFAELLRKGQTAPVQVVLDGTDSNTALIAVGYINQIANRFAQDYQLQMADRLRPSLATFAPNIELQERPWYNANLESRWFFVPGVIGTLVLVSVMQLTSFAVVREREIGTLEQLMVTPISPAELIVGKTLPFLIVGLANVIFVAILGSLWFEVPFRGNIFVLLLGTTLFLSSALGVGLLISTVCETQQQSFAISFFYISPAIMLSGFGYPITSMPTGLAMVHQSRSAALLSDRLARNFHQGRRTGGAMAADGRDGHPRSGHLNARNTQISQDAGLIFQPRHIGGRASAGLSLATVVLSLPFTPNVRITSASFAGCPTGVAHAVPAHTNASGTPFAALDANIARAAAGIDAQRSI